MNSPEERKVVGKKAKEVRLKQHLTQEQVAKRAGINANYYACIERGEVNPSLDKIQAIAKALGLKSFNVMF